MVHQGKRLTPTERKALVFCVAQGINPRKHSFDEKVLAQLAELGLIHMVQTRKRKPLWRATDVGRGVVGASGLGFTFLHKRSVPPYTGDPALAMRAEPEALVRC